MGLETLEALKNKGVPRQKLRCRSWNFELSRGEKISRVELVLKHGVFLREYGLDSFFLNIVEIYMIP